MSRSALIAVLILALPAYADPLNCIPKQANLVIKIESPRSLVENAVRLDAWRKLQAFPQIKEVLDSPSTRRFHQLLQYVENETQTRWPELIDKLAGKGIALGARLGTDPAPVVIIAEGHDDATVAKVFSLFVAGAKAEAERDGNIRVSEKMSNDIRIVSLGDDAHFACRGKRTLITNHKAALKASLDLLAGKNKDSVLGRATLTEARNLVGRASLTEARNLAGTDAAAWLWFDLAEARQQKDVNDFYENSRKDLVQLLIFGSTVDVLRRSDFLAVGLYARPDGYRLSWRVPAKRDELDPVMRVHVPPIGTPGSRPLLEPKGVVLSQSFYLDLGYVWSHRTTVIANANVRKDIEKGFTEISKIIPGTDLGTLLEKTGPHHRLVMMHTGEKLYNREPGQPIPPVAYVASLRDPAIGETLDGLLRSGGLLASFQTGWKMSESRHDGITIVSYRFRENGEPKFDDPDNLRFNAVPSFARVKDSIIVGSTPGIVTALIPLLKKETGVTEEVWQLKAYARGAADVLKAHPDSTVTDAVLTQGITLSKARQQMLDLAQWLRTLGTVTLSMNHGSEMWNFDLNWTFKP